MKTLLTILFVLLTVSPPADVDYDRADLFGSWQDADGDCQDTRAEVLINESYIPVTFDATGCRVVRGLWYDPYTGKTFTEARKLDVDHVVPLKEAYVSGLHARPAAVRFAYANDLANPGHLMAVEAGANRRKGAKDPADWLPPNENFHCAYVLTWLGIKEKWGLTIDRRELWAINDVLEGC